MSILSLAEGALDERREDGQSRTVGKTGYDLFFLGVENGCYQAY